MTSGEPKAKDNKGIFPATIVTVLDDDKVVINRGSTHGVAEDQRFLVFALSESDIIDPDTGDSLGRLEIIKGTGKVTHLQEKMATVTSDRRSSGGNKTVTRKTLPPNARWWVGALSTYSEPTIEEVTSTPGESARLPFDAPSVGDKAKPI